jgi:hypothetical protein
VFRTATNLASMRAVLKPDHFRFVPQTTNLLFRVATGVAALAIFLVVLSALVASHAPTAQDARVSEQIRVELTRAISRELPARINPVVTCLPRHNGTFIVVNGTSLTTDEKQRLALQAKAIGRQHDNRQVTVVFRNQ